MSVTRGRIWRGNSVTCTTDLVTGGNQDDLWDNGW
jgi:hypothetical protein